MSLIKTEFSPKEHGFRFINRFEANFPVKVKFQEILLQP